MCGKNETTTNGMENNELVAFESKLKRYEEYYKFHDDPYGVNYGRVEESIFTDEIRALYNKFCSDFDRVQGNYTTEFLCEIEIGKLQGKIYTPSYQILLADPGKLSSEITRLVKLMGECRVRKMEYCERKLNEGTEIE